DKTTDGTGTGLFQSFLTGLQPGKTYYIRAYAVNIKGTSYGNEISFRTPVALPAISTAGITDITRTSAISGGTIISDGGAAIESSGVCWGESHYPLASGNHTTDGSAAGTFSSIVSGLTPGTTYYLRAYATNTDGTAYGNEQTFTTDPVILPSLTTSVPTSVTPAGAVSGGNITDNGGGTITDRGICWSTTVTPTLSDFSLSCGTGTGSFQGNITGLEPGTHYYVRSYAINSAGTAFGNELEFSTPAVIPTILTANASEVTRTTAVAGGNITYDGGSTVSESGICYGTTHNPATSEQHTSDGTGTGIFSSTLSGLTPGTVYYARAYAINIAGTAYGNEITFTTGPLTLATITTNAISSVTPYTATSGGSISDNGGTAVSERGICWSTSSAPTTYDDMTSDGSGTGNFTSYLTGLDPVTTYHIRAYAVNSLGTAYGNERVFTTPVALPVLSTVAVTDVTRTTATSGGSISTNGGASITSSGVCWGTSHNPTASGSHTSDGTTSGTFASHLSGLTPGTHYYLRAYATNSAGTGYGDEASFTTNPILPATLTTSAITSVTSTSAVSGGNITDDGGGSITGRGICWSTSSFPDLSDQSTGSGTGTGSFSANMTGLMPGTTYHVRAYATNSAGTSYGNDLNFSTPAVLPAITTMEAWSITRTTASTGGNILSNGGSAVTASGICYGISHNPSVSGQHTSDGSSGGTFSSSLTDLTPGTVYYARAYATNIVGTSYGGEITFTTDPLSLASVTTTTISSITSASAASGGNISDDGGLAVTSRGICWSLSASPTTDDNITTNGTGTGSYTSNITGLSPATAYHVRAYATNSMGTAYGTDRTFTTLAELPVISTTAVTGVTRTTAISGGNITSDGGATITASGVCWSTSHNPVASGSHTNDGSSIGSFTSNLSGLIPGTQYYLRAYAKNSAGTAYGSEVTFTTDPILLATITTSAVTSVTTTSASSGGNITDDGGGSVSERGLCWSTSPSPTTSGQKLILGSGTGTFTGSITGLFPGITYHIRAYAINSAGTAYGSDLMFTTLTDVPSLTTTSVSDITRTGASSGATINSNGGLAITVSGICWSTSHNPSTSGQHTTDGTTSGSFASNATGLTPGTQYYLRAYATNSLGTGYGNELSFTTIPLSLPSVTTNQVTGVTSVAAVSGGIITDDGGSGVTARGVCWSTSSSPTTSDNFTSDGSGSGNFISNISGLDPQTTYYLRAWATNSMGTAYGSQRSFTTLENTDVTFTNPSGGLLLHSVGNKKVIYTCSGSNCYVRYSSDNGNSYNTGVIVNGLFNEDNKARIMPNGNIVLFCGSRAYYSTDNLTTIHACTVLDKDGTPYVYHTPVNPSYPGGYFNFMGGYAEYNGVVVMGTYTNNSMGASPVNLYYTLDGITWKVFYTFGQNPKYTDDGTPMGGTGGTLLGDPSNPLIARHIHAVNVGYDGNFYACTGDDGYEMHFLKCVYNSGSDTWTVDDLLSGESRNWQRMRALGVYERNGYLYWGSDGSDPFTYNGNTYESLGVYKCPIADINDPTKHILLRALPDACYSFINEGHIVFAGMQSYAAVYISYDYGENWTAYPKPSWMYGTVQGVWYNEMYKYMVTSYGYIIQSILF
ncbi:MAG TPA: hypothetical protein VJ963_03110, partial [Bacteroidales bacterium]|nr:hypothetical protein [Bacteroidales bacterium]